MGFGFFFLEDKEWVELSGFFTFCDCEEIEADAGAIFFGFGGVIRRVAQQKISMNERIKGIVKRTKMTAISPRYFSYQVGVSGDI